MRNVFITAIAAMAISTAAFAEGTVEAATGAALTGSINLEVTENAAGKYVGTTTLNVGVNANGLAFGGASVESVDGATFELDEWHIGTTVGAATLTFGKQGDIFVGNDFEIVGGTTIADVADDHESLQVAVGSATVMVGFTDITADVTEVENIQAAYDFAVGTVGLTAVGDYNFNSEEYVLGGKAAMDLTDDIAVGGLLTYDSATEVFGYEASAGYSIATVFVNGDDGDMLQNVGAGVATTVGGLGVYAEGSYNIDAEDTTIGAGISFSF